MPANIVLKNLFVLLIACCIALPLPAQQNNERPNIIYIMADDMGYADLSCYGRKDYQTPNLDKLAMQGVKFKNAYAAAPVCTPTRVAFMTGRYPARIALGLKEPIEWSSRDSLVGLSPAYPSIGTYLKNAGYETFLIGKWHLGFKPEYSPINNGFDYFFGSHGGAVDYISHTSPGGINIDLFENDKSIILEGYMTEILMNKTIDIIKQKHEKPFFISLMFNAPHWPWEGPGDKAYADTISWRTGGSPEIYAAIIKSMDDAVGKVMQALEDQQLSDHTIVIFTSDNGGERFSDMGIYKGGKMELWEGGIRVPAFIRWPGRIKPNTTTDQVANTMDWTATILALAGAKPQQAFPLDGIDMMSVIANKHKEIDRTMYWRIFQRMKHKAMREGNWKYLQDEKGDEYLFDLNADPSETNNLKEKKPKVFETLKNKYSLWEASVLKPIPLK